MITKSQVIEKITAEFDEQFWLQITSEGSKGVTPLQYEELKSFLTSALNEMAEAAVEGVKVEIEKMRPYAFRPCPACGRKLELSASTAEGLRYSCLSEDCLLVKKFNYYSVISRNRDEEISRSIDDLLAAISEAERKEKVWKGTNETKE